MARRGGVRALGRAFEQEERHVVLELAETNAAYRPQIPQPVSASQSNGSQSFGGAGQAAPASYQPEQGGGGGEL